MAAVQGAGSAQLCVRGMHLKRQRDTCKRQCIYTLDWGILSSSWINHWHVHTDGKLGCICICSDVFVLFRYNVCQSTYILVSLSLSRHVTNSLSCCAIIQS